MSTVIKVKGLSKQYRLGQVGTGTLSHDLNRWWASIRGKEDPTLKLGMENELDSSHSEFVWALRGIDFELEQGEVLGIIGKNGAGKSTLLKILSRVTGPTTGSINVKGRIASLLEVGTGFHPELSGRENIFLNGAILGMTKTEIRGKFDEIVDFSGIEKYIDTPVKRYSSGMYVRLAFSVAAHLEPEILIVDEVLAVGDAEFQKKCLGKMKDVSGQGRTVMFVSHNMAAVQNLCQHGMVLKQGKISFYGPTQEAIENYLGGEVHEFKVKDKSDEPNFFKKLHMISDKSDVGNDYAYDERFGIRVEMEMNEWNDDLELALSVYDRMLRRIFTKNVKLKQYYSGDKSIGLSVYFEEGFLIPDSYSWIVYINHPRTIAYDMNDNVLPFTIHETGSEFARYGVKMGCVFPPQTEILVDRN